MAHPRQRSHVRGWSVTLELALTWNVPFGADATNIGHQPISPIKTAHNNEGLFLSTAKTESIHFGVTLPVFELFRDSIGARPSQIRSAA